MMKNGVWTSSSKRLYRSTRDIVPFIIPLTDTYMSAVNPTTNYSSATSIIIGDTATDGTAKNRALIKPDFSGVPSGKTFVMAILQMTPIIDDSGNARTMYIHRCLKSLVISQATAIVYSTGNSWTAAGCSSTTLDYDGAVVMGSMSVPASPTLNTEMNMILDHDELQKLYDGTYTNNGMVLFVNTAINDAIYYASNEHATVEYRPKLSLFWI